jgi:hypothetical protein
MKFLQEKRNAVLILFIAIGLLWISTLTQNMQLFFQNTGLVYFVITSIFLFFSVNKIVEKWFLISLIFIALSIPLYIEYQKSFGRDMFGDIIFIPIYTLYILLFIFTPFYLHYQAKKLKK